jgi:hypothetical protein
MDELQGYARGISKRSLFDPFVPKYTSAGVRFFQALVEAEIADFRKAIELNPEVSGLAARPLNNLISQAANRR